MSEEEARKEGFRTGVDAAVALLQERARYMWDGEAKREVAALADEVEKLKGGEKK